MIGQGNGMHGMTRGRQTHNQNTKDAFKSVKKDLATYLMCMSSLSAHPKGASDPVGLQLETAVSCHVGGQELDSGSLEEQRAVSAHNRRAISPVPQIILFKEIN